MKTEILHRKGQEYFKGKKPSKLSDLTVHCTEVKSDLTFKITMLKHLITNKAVRNIIIIVNK